MLKRTIGVTVFLIAINMALVATHAMAAPSRVFVTSTTYTGGGFGGSSGADNICNQRAAAGSLDGTYTAWLSTSTINAADRVYHNPDGYINTKAEMVVNDWAALIDGDNNAFLNPIEYDENGANSLPDYVWTGTDEDGQGTGYNCENWTSSAVTVPDGGTTGSKTDATAKVWSRHLSRLCHQNFHLYCFEDESSTPPIGSAVAVPTMNEWGMILLSLFLIGSAAWFIMRRRRAS